jgi:hypothetical protein
VDFSFLLLNAEECEQEEKGRLNSILMAGRSGG